MLNEQPARTRLKGVVTNFITKREREREETSDKKRLEMTKSQKPCDETVNGAV